MWAPPREVEPTVVTMPAWSPSPTVNRSLDGLYERELIVVFDCPRRWYGLGLMRSSERIKRASGCTCLKLLTVHMRIERFNAGHLAAMFECGQITAILH